MMRAAAVAMLLALTGPAMSLTVNGFHAGGGEKLLLVILLDILVAGDVCVVLAFLLLVALSVLRLVLVVVLSVETAVVLDVLHGGVHGTALAALVAVFAAGAINELLLG